MGRRDTEGPFPQDTSGLAWAPNKKEIITREHMEVKVTSVVRKHPARDRDRETEWKRMGSEKMF